MCRNEANCSALAYKTLYVYSWIWTWPHCRPIDSLNGPSLEGGIFPENWGISAGFYKKNMKTFFKIAFKKTNKPRSHSTMSQISVPDFFFSPKWGAVICAREMGGQAAGEECQFRSCHTSQPGEQWGAEGAVMPLCLWWSKWWDKEKGRGGGAKARRWTKQGRRRVSGRGKPGFSP